MAKQEKRENPFMDEGDGNRKLPNPFAPFTTPAVLKLSTSSETPTIPNIRGHESLAQDSSSRSQHIIPPRTHTSFAEVAWGRPGLPAGPSHGQTEASTRDEPGEHKRSDTKLEGQINAMETRHDRLELTISNMLSRISELEDKSKQLHQEMLQMREQRHSLTFTGQRQGGNGGPLNSNLLEFIKSLDFSPPHGIQAWITAKADPRFSAMDHVLWAPDAENAYIVRVGHGHPLVLSRASRGHSAAEEALPDTTRCRQLAAYRNHVVEVEYHAPMLGVPRHVIIVGEIWKRKTPANLPPYCFYTNYYLAVDVTKSEKSLWVLYGYEHNAGGSGGAQTERYALREVRTFHGVGVFDCACLVYSMDEAETGRDGGTQIPADLAHDTLNGSGRILKPFFTEPNLDELFSSIPHH